MDVKNQRTAQVLKERARLLARPVVSEARAADEIEVAVCTVGSEQFGFPVHLLREIVPLPPVTPLPFAPEVLLGIVQVRGTLLSVFDLGLLCGAKGETNPEHLVVVETNDGPIGFTVDKVLACRNISPSTLQQSSSPIEHRATLGITSDLVLVFDVPRLLALNELVIE